MRSWLAAALLLLGSTEAAAAAPGASFRFAGVQFEAPLPEGYCLPSGADVDAAQLLAAADRENVTHLTLYPCRATEGPAVDYILIKTPRRALLGTFDRQQLLSELGETFASREFSTFLSQLPDRLEEDMSTTLGTRFDLTGQIAPRGRDDVCAYLAGTVQVTSDQVSYPISIATCITVIAGRALTINWYGPDRGSVGVAELMIRARRFAERITGHPPS